MRTLRMTAVMMSVGLLASVAVAGAHENHTPHVYIIEPADGATTDRTVKVVMGVEGMQVRPAGEVVAGTGHHHLMIDGDFIPRGETVPKDATHLHFGKGQTETTIQLTPGRHTLTLQFADGHHASYGKAMSRTVHITVR
ncbi:MAG: DUF4399 domain-containing protein [Mariprofundaceae bacterium]|nr:DUF4399 domain-containing protein [Mariprofundaceae bacterium]